METTKALTRLDVVKGYEDNEKVVRLFNEVIESRTNEELFKHNILAICSYFQYSLDTVDKLTKKLESRDNHINRIFGNLANALDNRENELHNEAVAKVFGMKQPNNHQ